MSVDLRVDDLRAAAASWLSEPAGVTEEQSDRLRVVADALDEGTHLLVQRDDVRALLLAGLPEGRDLDLEGAIRRLSDPTGLDAAVAVTS